MAENKAKTTAKTTAKRTARRTGPTSSRGTGGAAERARRASGNFEADVREHVRGRARRLGMFLVLLGAGGLALNLRVYVPALREGEISMIAYPAVSIAGLVGLALVLLGIRVIASGDDLLPD